MREVLASYLAFLLSEMQKDAAVIDNPWVYLPIAPFCLYAVYMAVKWFLLLAPVSLPLAIIFGKPSPKIIPWLKGKN